MTLPQHFYSDPARIVEANDINQKGCRVCAHSSVILGRPVCDNNLKFPACKRDKKRGFTLGERA